MIGLVVGLLGLALGALAALFHVVALAVIAGAIALATGVAVFRLVSHLRKATALVDELEDKVDELEEQVEKESEARSDLETKLASRIQLTAVRRNSSGDALTDGATGLFSEGYFTVALDARIAAARRQLEPVAVVLMEVIEGPRVGPAPTGQPQGRRRVHHRHHPRGRHGVPAARRRLRAAARGHRRERRHLDGRAHPSTHHGPVPRA